MKNEKIHNKLDALQFNSTLETGKFLIVTVPCVGYGGQLSIHILGMRLAYMYDRSVIFDNQKNPYTNCYESISKFSIDDTKDFTCVKLKLYEKQNDKIVYLDFDEYWLNFKNRKFINNWVPPELVDQKMSNDYFNGQLATRFKLLPIYRENIESSKKRMAFSKPIIGVHIRRGDKKNESEYVPMRIYNYYIKKAVKETGIRRVFVTSDDENIFSKLNKDPEIEFIYDTEEKRYNNANHEFLSKYPELKNQETQTAIKIIELLSDCDCLIGQINTHFTTIAYEMSLARTNSTTKIYFVNKNFRDIYINNDPNIFLFFLDVIKKITHTLLVIVVRKIKPFLLNNNKVYKKIKKLYYGEER